MNKKVIVIAISCFVILLGFGIIATLAAIIYPAYEFFNSTQSNSEKSLNDEGLVWVSKIPTQCDEDWHAWSYEEERGIKTNEEIIETFLKEEYEVGVIQIFIEPIEADFAVCAACSCPSFTKVHIEVNSDDQKILENLGFIKSEQPARE